MATLSIRTLTPANNKAKVPSDERSQFFREQYKEHGLSFAGKTNIFGVEYTAVEAGNHHSRLALRKAFERILESPTPPQETAMVIIADHAFLSDGKEEERTLEKIDGKDKMVKVEVEREGIQKLLEEFGPKFQKIVVLFEKSEDGSKKEEELKQHISLLLDKKAHSQNPVQVLHFQQEVTPGLYAQFVNNAAGIPL